MIKILYIICLSLIYFQVGAVDSGSFFGIDKISETFKVGGDDLVQTSDNLLGYIIGLFYFIALAFGVYGGFMILVSGGDEDKVKKGKNIIIYMVIGLIVIFLASQLVNWVINVFGSEDIVGPSTNN